MQFRSLISRMVRPFALLLLLGQAATVTGIHANSGNRIMAALQPEATADDPSPFAVVKNVFRLSSRLLYRTAPGALTHETRVATAGIRN